MSLKENVCFRVDASTQMGTGHFMRCLTLARELVRTGACVRFISRHLPVHLRNMLIGGGIELVILSSVSSDDGFDDLPHSHWLGVTQDRDARDAVLALSDRSWRWIVVDHYALDHRWESPIRQSCQKIMVIDDLADRRHDCDVLLDQNHYFDAADRYLGKVSDNCLLLLGPSYVLLREEFRLFRKNARLRDGPVKRVMVFFGGIDANNYTAIAIHALLEIGTEALIVDVVLGRQNPHKEEIERLCQEHHLTCHVQTEQMAELMTMADLSVGAGGSSTWERCCLGLPTLAICTAANQNHQLADAASAGLLIAPEMSGDLRAALVLHLRAFFHNGGLRKFISRNAMQLVDAYGTSRILARIGISGITMRVANNNDSQQLFEWRSHPRIRSVSRNPGPITFEDHQRWFSQVVSDPKRILLIGEREGLPVGVVRFDQQSTFAEVSIYLVPEPAQCGQGQDLLSAAEQWVLRNCAEIKNIQATVLEDNVRSLRLFLRSGYGIESTVFSKRLN